MKPILILALMLIFPSLGKPATTEFKYAKAPLVAWGYWTRSYPSGRVFYIPAVYAIK